MKAAFENIPAPLQKQTLIRLSFGVLFLLLLFVLLFVARDLYILLPCAGASIFFTVSALMLFRRAILGEYITVSGICKSVGVTPVKRRAKYLILQTGEHTIQVSLRSRLRTFSAGAAVDLYVAQDTPIYEKDGIQILYSYLAINIKYTGRQVNGV